MRVLSTFAMCVAASGCYDPSIEDCHFACGVDDACPDGTTCMSGSCRATTTGTCPRAADGGVDGRVDGVDGGVACPTTSPCGETVVRVSADDCAVLCTQPLTFANALGVCGSDPGTSATWHIAILDTAVKRTAFGQALDGVGWIGLQRTITWNWLNPSNEVQAGSGAPWASGEPGAVNPDGVFDSNGDVFRTGSVADTKPVFCEYEP